MNDKKYKDKLEEIMNQLENGIKEVYESGRYKEYLKSMSKFHNYSLNNTILILCQKPDATYIAGFNAWKNNHRRHVKKGEKAIQIIAPAPITVTTTNLKKDSLTKQPLLDDKKQPIYETTEITVPKFKVASVFDLSQTEGEPLPMLTNKLEGEVQDYSQFMGALTKLSPVPIGYEMIQGETNGYYHFADQRIAIKLGMSEAQTVKTAIHEIAHALLHNPELIADQAGKDRRTKEVEAESIAYTVCQYLKLDTSDYSFGYLAGWSSGKELKELKNSLETIHNTAHELIARINDYLEKAQRKRVVPIQVSEKNTEIQKSSIIMQIKENMDKAQEQRVLESVSTHKEGRVEHEQLYI